MFEGENVVLICKPQYSENLKLKSLMIKEANANFYKYYKTGLQFANRQIVKTALTIKGAELEQREFNFLPSGLFSRQNIYTMNNQFKELDKVVKYEYYTQAY